MEGVPAARQPLEGGARRVVDLLVEQDLVVAVPRGLGDGRVLGKAVRRGRGALVPLAAEGYHPGAEVHEAVVRAAPADEIRGRPHIPAVQGTVHLAEPLRVRQDLLPGEPREESHERLVERHAVRRRGGARRFDEVPEPVDVHVPYCGTPTDIPVSSRKGVARPRPAWDIDRRPRDRGRIHAATHAAHSR